MQAMPHAVSKDIRNTLGTQAMPHAAQAIDHAAAVPHSLPQPTGLFGAGAGAGAGAHAHAHDLGADGLSSRPPSCPSGNLVMPPKSKGCRYRCVANVLPMCS